MFKKMLGWLLELIPDQYKVSVIAKKVAYLLGKLLVGFLAGKAAAGGGISVEQVAQINAGVTALTTVGLEIIHDWLRLKFPDATWL